MKSLYKKYKENLKDIEKITDEQWLKINKELMKFMGYTFDSGWLHRFTILNYQYDLDLISEVEKKIKESEYANEWTSVLIRLSTGRSWQEDYEIGNSFSGRELRELATASPKVRTLAVYFVLFKIRE